MKTLSLSISERLNILRCLPEKGDALEMTIAEGISDLLFVTKQEGMECSLKTNGNEIHLDKDPQKEVEMSDPQLLMIKLCALRMHDYKEVTVSTLPLFKRIMTEF